LQNFFQFLRTGCQDREYSFAEVLRTGSLDREYSVAEAFYFVWTGRQDREYSFRVQLFLSLSSLCQLLFWLKIVYQIRLKNPMGHAIHYFPVCLQALEKNSFITFSRNQSGSVNFCNYDQFFLIFKNCSPRYGIIQF